MRNYRRDKVSQRGVVFFRGQNDLTNDLQKKLILRLGELTGRPSTSGLHIHPILNSERELGGSDPEISTISSVQHNKFYVKTTADSLSPKKQSSAQWHSDIAFEPVPADYTSLRLVELPETGGGEQRVHQKCRGRGPAGRPFGRGC
jgi:alpha-ketoglutarate-dependent taurine dioxygenase